MSDIDAQIRKILRAVRGCATDDQFTETYERLHTVLRKARTEALEEAAAICENLRPYSGSNAGHHYLACAAAIRALASPPEPSDNE